MFNTVIYAAWGSMVTTWKNWVCLILSINFFLSGSKTFRLSKKFLQSLHSFVFSIQTSIQHHELSNVHGVLYWWRMLNKKGQV